MTTKSRIPAVIMTVMVHSQPSAITQNENIIRFDRKSTTENYSSTSSFRIKNNKFYLFKLQENKRLLHGLSNLPQNWNSYGAGAFDQEFVKKIAIELGSLIYQPTIFPTGRQSIQMEYHNGANYLEFEINNQYNIEYYLKKSEEEIEGTTTFKQLNYFVEKFYAR
jgi:hypothetical protein